MVKLGVDTGHYGQLPLSDALDRLAGLGWKDVQVSYGHLEPFLDDAFRPKAGLSAVRRRAEKLGVTIWQVHCNTELGPDDSHVESNRRWLDCAKALGAKYLITHANQAADYNSEPERQECLELNRACLEDVASYAGGLGLRVALENRLERPRAACRRFGARMRDFMDLIGAAGAECAGVCLDTSHTRVSRLSFAEEVSLCGEMLLATQISDSDGETQHRMPFTLDIDWPDVIRSLKRSGYDGLLALDCGTDGTASLGELDGALRSVEARLRPLLGGDSGDTS